MYVVTGATGNTGNIVARKLLAEGQKVRVIGRASERLKPLVALGAEAFFCDLSDASALTRAFSGASAVYAMVPPDMASTDYRAHQDRITDAMAKAVEEAGVRFAVSLSSFGADKAVGTGPVVGLHLLEEKLNRIARLNVLHLRAGYFMENTMAQVGPIKSMGVAAGPLLPELRLPMIATRDIGDAAAEELLRLEFRGRQARELLGQRDITMNDAASIIGKAIGKPDLKYVRLPNEQVRDALTGLGISPNAAGLITEMANALNIGHMVALEPRSGRNTTPTSYEAFIQQEFVPRFRGTATAAQI